MLENTNIKQFYPGPILNKTLDITDFLFKDPEQIHITYTYKNEDGSLDNRELTYGTEYEVAKILPSDVTQADAALTASTGRVTLKADINVALGERLTIYRESEIIQETQYPRTGPFPAASHEGALDYLTMQNQEQQDQIDRSLKVPISTANFDGALPIPVPARALKINDSGSGFEFSEYDPDTALETTKEYMEGAQTAASNALASQNAAASSASAAASSVTEAGNLVTSGIADINDLVTAADENLDAKIDAGATTLNNTINTFKTYMNENPYSGKTIGEFFWTFRKDTINGAYECNGQEFEKSLFSGDQNPYDLLVAGKLPVKTYEEYQAEIEAHGVCTYFGLDTINQKFKVPKIKEIYVQADEVSKVGQFVSESLPNVTGYLGLNGQSTAAWWSDNGQSGALYGEKRSNDYGQGKTELQGATVDSSTAQYNTIVFNASRSSSTYQDNAKVQPNSIKLRPMVQLVTSATEVSFADYEEQFTAALNKAISALSITGQKYLENLTPNKFVQFSNRRRIKIKGDTYLRLDTQTKNYTVVGSPTITDDGVASGFNNSNYLITPSVDFIANNSFEFSFKFNIATKQSRYSRFFSSVNNGRFRCAINDKKLIELVGNDNQMVAYTLNDYTYGQDYWVKCGYSDGKFYIEGSDDGVHYTLLVTNQYANTFTSLKDSFYIGSGGAVTLNRYLENGSIDLKSFSITVDGKEVYKPLVGPLWYSNLKDIEVEAESLLDEGGTFQNGKAYSLFLVPNTNYDGVELKVSLNSTAPTGYTPNDTRRIGGWHTECANVGDTSSWAPNHKLNGWLAGDILPHSVWTLYHRPYASPNNTIYIPCGIPFWRTIYDHSGTLATTNFEFGGTITRNRSFYGHMQDMMHAGYILPTYEQAAISGFDCEPLKAIMGKAEASVTTAGGHVNESNHRIVSSYGAEDCVGCTWKITTIGAIGGSGWNTDPSVGVHQYGSVNVLLVGGYWANSGNAGPFATDGSDSALTASSGVASFGVSYPLPRKSEGNV